MGSDKVLQGKRNINNDCMKRVLSKILPFVLTSLLVVVFWIILNDFRSQATDTLDKKVIELGDYKPPE